MKTTTILSEEYISAAVAHGKATLEGDFKTANKQYTILTNIYKKIKEDQQFAVSFLEKLFQHPNVSVRIWASSHALGVKTQTYEALRVLQQISEDTSNGILRLDAEMVLKEWERKGKLKF